MARAKNRAIKSLVSSKNKYDKQFINMHRIRQAMRFGVKLGFKGFSRHSDSDENKD